MNQIILPGRPQACTDSDIAVVANAGLSVTREVNSLLALLGRAVIATAKAFNIPKDTVLREINRMWTETKPLGLQ